MKTLMAAFAVAVTLVTSPLALAQDASTDASTDNADDGMVLSYGSGLSCTKTLADFKKRDKKAEMVQLSFLLGVWSGMNALDDSDAHGMIGKNLSEDQLYMAVLGECRKDTSKGAQEALYEVWYRYRDKAVEAANSGTGS